VASTIKIKRSNVAGKQPNTSTISVGELAINYKDQKLYSSNGTAIFEIGAGGGSTAYEKTFNIVGLFAAPITGTARAVPIANTTITKIQLVNSNVVSANLTVRLNKNGVSVNTYTILSGNYISNYTGLNIPFTSTDYLTVDVLSGSGSDFSLTISS